MKGFFVGLFAILKESGQGWSRDNASLLAAALTFYTIFALAPLLVIAVAVAGVAFNDTEVREVVLAEVKSEFGEEAEGVVENIITDASKSDASRFATVVSAVLLLVGASSLFAHMQRALNMIWGLRPDPEAGVLNIIRKRALAFAMVLMLALLLVLSFATSTIITAVGDRLFFWLPGIGTLLPQINYLASLVILTLLFALLFKMLPDAHITWKDVLLGAAVTTVLFMFGRFLIGLYLAYGSATSTYSVAGSLVLILLWVYFSSQIFLFGAEFTQVYANKHGSRVRPTNNAIWRIREAPALSPAQEEVQAYRIVTVPPEDESHAARPTSRWRGLAATGLLGLAAGLLLGFLSSLRKRET